MTSASNTVYLVDTDVISARSPTKVSSTELALWMDTHSEKLFLSVVTIAEIEDGIAKSKRDGATSKATHLTAWVETLLHLYAKRILPFSIDEARIAGALSDIARSCGQAPGFADIMIAATAQRHGLTVLSRNLRHFEPLGVAVIDPFAGLPQA